MKFLLLRNMISAVLMKIVIKKVTMVIVIVVIVVILMVTMQYIDISIKNKGGQSIQLLDLTDKRDALQTQLTDYSQKEENFYHWELG